MDIAMMLFRALSFFSDILVCGNAETTACFINIPTIFVFLFCPQNHVVNSDL